MAKPTTAMVKEEPKKPALVTTEKPAYLLEMEKNRQSAPREDNFDSSDSAVPYIKLLQGTSEECKTFDNAKAGRYWHTGMDLDLGSELNFVIASRRKRYMLMAPLEDGQGVLARSDDFVSWNVTGKWEVKMKGIKKPIVWEIDSLNVEESGLTKWGTSNPDDENSPPAATLFYDYLVLLPDHLDLGPAVFSMTRSKIKKAKKGLNDKIDMHRSAGRPMQSLVFKAGVVTEKNPDNQDYFNSQFMMNGFASNELYEQAEELKNVLTDYTIKGEEKMAAGEADAERGSRVKSDNKNSEY